MMPQLQVLSNVSSSAISTESQQHSAAPRPRSLVVLLCAQLGDGAAAQREVHLGAVGGAGQQASCGTWDGRDKLLLLLPPPLLLIPRQERGTGPGMLCSMAAAIATDRVQRAPLCRAAQHNRALRF